MPASIVGAAIVGVPVFLVIVIVLGRQRRALLWFAGVLLGVGLGYLATTGALEDIAKAVAPGLIAPAKSP